MADAEPPGSPRVPKASGPAYRPTREYESGDASMRTLALAAVGLTAAVMGGVFVLSHRHQAARGVPVIEPDATPLRVKPADPGGMKIAGADDALPESGGAEADKLAPPPETPAPQALQQQTRAGVMAPPRLYPPAVAAPAPPSVAVPAPLVPPPPTRLPAPAPAKAGTVSVQLAALESEAAAHAEWTRLGRVLPGLLASYVPQISRTDQDGKTFWRLRVGGFADIAAATAFCARLRAAGGGCTLARF